MSSLLFLLGHLFLFVPLSPDPTEKSPADLPTLSPRIPCCFIRYIAVGFFFFGFKIKGSASFCYFCLFVRPQENKYDAVNDGRPDTSSRFWFLCERIHVPWVSAKARMAPDGEKLETNSPKMR
uniref:Putative secreted protein n=1 Tax=Ixodes scapularis TaxID=6945 RepID=A0A4D5RCU4_IXOSC